MRRPRPSRAAWFATAVSLLTASVALIWLRQGLDMGQDGLWLLGAQALKEGALFERIALPDGPGRYALLATFLWFLGSSAATLAGLKAALLLGALAALAAWTRPQVGGWWWWAPAVAWAMAPVGPLPTLLLALAAILCAAASRPSRARWAGAGLVLAALLSLGVPAGTLGSVVVIALTVAGCRPRDRGGWIALAAGPTIMVAAGLVVVVGAGVASEQWGGAWGGTLDAAGRNLPLGWVTALQTDRLGPPLAELQTGETWRDLWPGHGAMRAASLRGWMLAVILLPLAVPVVWRGRWSLDHRAAWILSIVAALGRLLHPSVASLSWQVLLALPALLLLARASRGAPRVVVIAMLVLMTLPRTAERVWLTAQVGREGLVIWETPRAEVLLARERIQNLERVVGALSTPPHPPMLVWPAIPGLHFLLEIPTPTRHPILPRTPTARADALSQLRATPPATVLLSIDSAGISQRVRRQAPDLWGFLRTHYALEGDVRGPDSFRALRRQPPEEILALPLPRRLPDLELGTGNDRTPPLAPDFTVGQTFVSGDQDLAGLSVRWSTAGSNLTATVRIDVWELPAVEGDPLALLDFFDAEIAIDADQHRSFLRFGPVPATAGRHLKITFELMKPTSHPLHLIWHRHDATGRAHDLYPEGTAVLNGQPVAADLYLSTY